jgi:hypothetical protein
MFETLNKFSPLIATVIIPVVIAIIGSQYTSAVKEREVQGKFVALAVDILKQKPSDENRNIREWSTNILNKYSGVRLSDAARNDLINNISFDVAEDFTVKESGLNIDMNGGPVTVNVVFEYGHTGTYHIELLVDGNYDATSDNEPLVFSPSLIKELHSLPPDEQNSILQMALTIKKVSQNNKYKVHVIFEQDKEELTRETLVGVFVDSEVDRTLMVNINEIQ